MPGRSSKQVGEAFHARLLARRPEIEDAVLIRVFAISGPLETLGPGYAEGLRAAVRAAIDHALSAFERGEEQPSPPPSALLAQARLAARNGISLDTVCRRYVAGHALLAEFLVEEAEAVSLCTAALQRLLRAQADLLDRLLEAVGEEHAHEAEGRLSSSERRDAKRIERLLAGESLDTSQIAYDFEAHHVAAIAKGPGAAETIRTLAEPLDCRLLLIRRKEETVWAWLGGRRFIDSAELRHDAVTQSPQVSLGLGEPACGLNGWRLTHQQARAALPIAQRSPKKGPVRYADVALLASIFQDELLVTSLRVLYLAPLEREGDGGEAARATLRAYLATERNVSSAAALLGVKRHTVTNRLRAIEGLLGRSLRTCAVEMDAALRLEELEGVAPLHPTLRA